MQNTLYFGDNLPILREYIKDESVDLIYLDPPFNSNRSYNVLFKEVGGEESGAQITAFEDTWTWGAESAQTLVDLPQYGSHKIVRMINALVDALGHNAVTAYLVMMTARLVELHRVLKPTGSMYLHCDPTASHYLKIILDAIFDPRNFRNEVVWSYRRYTAASNRFQRLHDVLLFYGKGKDITFNDIREEYGERSGKADSHYKQDENGKWFRWQKRKGQEPYKVCLSGGVRMGDVWDIPIINASAKERLGYPTQKPLPLLERIIEASTNPTGVVLDPFCGCGTTIHAAQKLGRTWIGIDITHLAISLIKYRLKDAFGDLDYKVIGEPVTVSGAEELAKQNRFQFEWWALSLIKAKPHQGKTKGADTGIDGLIYISDDPKQPITKTIIVQVKSGKVDVRTIRELNAVVDREKAIMGVLITLNEPTGRMVAEAIAAGVYISPIGHKYPKIQILTIEQLLSGATPKYPYGTEATFKQANREQPGEQNPLFGQQIFDY